MKNASYARGARERARILHFLTGFTGYHLATYRQIQECLGARAVNTAFYHVKQLCDQGLALKSAGKVTLSNQGRLLASYIAATEETPAFERAVRNYRGHYCSVFARDVHAIARELDEAYASTRDGLRRRTAAGGRELERKATYRAVITAMKKFSTIKQAADSVGLSAGAFDQRVRTLFSRAFEQLGPKV